MLKRYLYASIMIAALAGCGDDEGASNSVVDQDKRVSELTAEEQTQACMFWEGKGQELEVKIAAKIEECTGIDSDPPDFESDCMAGNPDFATCELTVGEVEGCLSAIFSQANDAINDASCDNLSETEPPSRPSECASTDAQCPQISNE